MWELPRARRCHWRARRRWRAGRFSEAMTWAARSIELLEHRNQRHAGAEVGELAAALMVLADFHSQLAAHAAAEPLLRRAIALFPPSTDGRGTVTTLAAVRLGNTQRLRGSYQDAETT